MDKGALQREAKDEEDEYSVQSKTYLASEVQHGEGRAEMQQVLATKAAMLCSEPERCTQLGI